MTNFPPSADDAAARNVADLLAHALEHGPAHRALVVFDRRSELNAVLTEAYRRALPDGTFIDFDAVAADEVLAAFAQLAPRDLVVLVQTTSFRLNEYRIRMELFQRGLKEHEAGGRGRRCRCILAPHAVSGPPPFIHRSPIHDCNLLRQS